MTVKYFTDRQNTCQWHVKYLKNVSLTGKTPVKNQKIQKMRGWVVVLLTGILPVSDTEKSKNLRKMTKNHCLTGKIPVSATTAESFLHALTGKTPVSTITS